MTITANGRTADHDIEPIFLERWSPRAYDRSVVTDEELATLFEAARWAPSAFNAQPWRFLYARRDTPDWDRFLSGLIAFNQSWVQNASVLIYVLSDTLMQGKPGTLPTPSHSHSFDAGAAWAYLALQGAKLGLQAHGMTGVDFDKARDVLAIPERFRIEAAVAVGRQGDTTELPEMLQSRETPSDRNSISSFAFEGHLPA